MGGQQFLGITLAVQPSSGRRAAKLALLQPFLPLPRGSSGSGGTLLPWTRGAASTTPHNLPASFTCKNLLRRSLGPMFLEGCSGAFRKLLRVRKLEQEQKRWGGEPPLSSLWTAWGRPAAAVSCQVPPLHSFLPLPPPGVFQSFSLALTPSSPGHGWARVRLRLRREYMWPGRCFCSMSTKHCSVFSRQERTWLPSWLYCSALAKTCLRSARNSDTER